MSKGQAMVDKSDSSSFEDLAGASELADENNEDVNNTEKTEDWLDILGSGSLLKKIIKEGNSDIRPQRTDLCRIRYEGRLKSTGLVVDKQDDIEIHLGDGDVIQGIDFTLALMHDGEIAELQIASRFGFGESGMAPDIPPNAALEYTLELISSRPEPDIETLSVHERKTIGNKKRERGNWWYSMQEPTLAIQCYRKAIEYLDETKGGITDPTADGNLPDTSDDLLSLLSDRIKVYNNMAAAQMKQGSYEAALHSVETVLSCQPNNVKALFRKGKILSQKNDIEGALQAVRAALALSPGERSVRAELTKLEDKARRDGARERELAKKMLGATTPGTSPGAKTPSGGSNKKKVFVWGSVLFSVAIGVISIAVYRYKFMQ